MIQILLKSYKTRSVVKVFRTVATLILLISVGDRMFLEMQDFDFVQIQSNLPKSNHFCPNFAEI